MTELEKMPAGLLVKTTSQNQQMKCKLSFGGQFFIPINAMQISFLKMELLH